MPSPREKCSGGMGTRRTLLPPSALLTAAAVAAAVPTASVSPPETAALVSPPTPLAVATALVGPASSGRTAETAALCHGSGSPSPALSTGAGMGAVCDSATVTSATRNREVASRAADVGTTHASTHRGTVRTSLGPRPSTPSTALADAGDSSAANTSTAAATDTPVLSAHPHTPTHTNSATAEEKRHLC